MVTLTERDRAQLQVLLAELKAVPREERTPQQRHAIQRVRTKLWQTRDSVRAGGIG